MKPIDLVVRCRRCGREWIPTYADTRAGRWRVCPRCRVDDPEPLAAVTEWTVGVVMAMDTAATEDDHEEGQEAA